MAESVPSDMADTDMTGPLTAPSRIESLERGREPSSSSGGSSSTKEPGRRVPIQRHLSQPVIGRWGISRNASRVEFVLQNTQTLTVGQRIDEIGFGVYQVHAFIIACGAIMTEASAVQTVAAVVLAVSDEFDVQSSMGMAMFMSCMFIGIQVGTAIAGPVCDSIGRRAPLFISYTGMIALSVACAFATSASMLYVFLLLFGCFAGTSLPVAMIYLSEVMPSKLRGLSAGALGIAFTAGNLWATFGCWLYMPSLEDGPWRLLFRWAIYPACGFLLFASLSRSTSADSPSYLAVSGQAAEVVRAINVIADMNQKPQLKVFFEKAVQMDDSLGCASFSKVCAVLTNTSVWTFLVIQAFLFLAKEFVAAGTVAFWPLAWATLASEGFHGVSPAGEMFITHIFRLPGVVLAMGILHLLPRRGALLLAAGSCAAAALLMIFLLGEQAWEVGFVGVVLIQLAFPTWQMLTVLLASEIFPTEVRGWAFSASYFVGRFGSEAAQMVVHSSMNGFLITCASLGVVSIFLTFFIPETKDCELVDFADEKVVTEQQPLKPGEVSGHGGELPCAQNGSCDSEAQHTADGFGSGSAGLPVGFSRQRSRSAERK